MTKCLWPSVSVKNQDLTSYNVFDVLQRVHSLTSYNVFIRFEQCSFFNPDTGYYSAQYPNAPVAQKHGIEQVGIGTTILSGCDLNALQTSLSSNKWKSAWAATGAVLQNCTVTHGNWHGEGSFSAGLFTSSYLVNTKFRETSVFAAHPDDTYFVEDGSDATQSAIGPGNSIEGPTAGSNHYISCDSRNTSGLDS